MPNPIHTPAGCDTPPLIKAALVSFGCAKSALKQSLIDEAAFIHAYDQAFERIDREFDLPNRTINLLIQWIQQNHCRMPARRKNAPELILLMPEMIDRIEAIVAGCFQPPRHEDAALSAPGERKIPRGPHCIRDLPSPRLPCHSRTHLPFPRTRESMPSASNGYKTNS